MNYLAGLSNSADQNAMKRGVAGPVNFAMEVHMTGASSSSVVPRLEDGQHSSSNPAREMVKSRTTARK
jgi:hypothetical protein